MEKRRLKAAGDLLRGVMQSEVARIHEVSRTTVSRWYKALTQSGIKGLGKRKATGRPSRLTPLQFAEIAKAYSEMMGRKTCFRLRNYIQDKYGVSYHHDHVSRMIVKIKRAGKPDVKDGPK